MSDTSYSYTPLAVSTAAVTNRFVASTNMSLTTYTIANASPAFAGAVRVTVTHTTVAGADTLGVITIVGTDINGTALTEVITPLAGTIATGTKFFRTVVSATSTGWTAVSTADTIVIGHDAGAVVIGSGGILHAIVVNTTAAAAIVVSDAKGTIATLKASIGEGTYVYDVQCAGFLRVATTSTNDITILHTPTVPTYATA